MTCRCNKQVFNIECQHANTAGLLAFSALQGYDMQAQGFWFWMEGVMNIFFWADLVMNFFVAYEVRGGA